jgi:hypothetical protein
MKASLFAKRRSIVDYVGCMVECLLVAALSPTAIGSGRPCIAGSRNRPVSLAALALVVDIELLLDDCLRPNRAERRHLIVRWSSLPFGQLVLAGFGNALNAETICSRIQWCAGDPECRV